MKNLMKKRNALKNRKGFTLIEIIVVLVILAILAAALIPTMLGFVKDAQAKASIANATMLKAGGSVIGAQYGQTGAGNIKKLAAGAPGVTGDGISDIGKATETFTTLVGSDIVAADAYEITLAGGKVTVVKYWNAKSGTTITIDIASATTTVKEEANPITA